MHSIGMSMDCKVEYMVNGLSLYAILTNHRRGHNLYALAGAGQWRSQLKNLGGAKIFGWGNV